MREEIELKFRKVVNELTKSKRSAIIFMDGKPDSLKKIMVDKLIDRIEPSRYQLYRYEQKHFITKPFWQNGVSMHEIAIWDGSYKQEKKLTKEQKREIKFFEAQMKRYNFPVVAFKFVNDKDFSIEYNEKHNQYIVKGKDENVVFEGIIDKLTEIFNEILSKKSIAVNIPEKIATPVNLSLIENDYKYDDETWKYLQKKYQKKIRKLHEKMIDKGKSIVIVFQGIDGAGKSSSIRRLTEKMCPHWYSIYGIKAPTEQELEHHHLWRFITKLPKKGEIAIFDRSWYERLTAERVLKLNDNMWVYGVEEIKEFEKELEKNGIHVVKFWFNIDKETQGQRFKERENNPLKSWKISKQDYLTREKWDEYQKVFSEMLGAFEDFHLIDSRNKREARVNVLKILVKEMKKLLK